jgi:outer membrane protein OmpA-like peptidoglycan-associated protein
MTRRTLSFLLRALAAVATLAVAAPAVAQDEQDSFTLPVERFRPAIDDKGLATTEGGSIPAHLGMQGGLIFNYAYNPLVIRNNNDDSVVTAIVAHRLAADALFTIGLFDYVSVGVDLPLTLVQTAGDLGELGDVVGAQNGLAAIGVGDLKLVPKVRILREDKHFISLSIIPALTLPTAGGINFKPEGAEYEYGTSYLGEGPGKVAFIPELAISTNLKGVRVAGNLAYRLRQPTRFLGELQINPEIVYRIGAGYDFATIAPRLGGLMLFGELFGATPDRNPFGLFTDDKLTGNDKVIADVTNRLTNPLEWAVGVRYKLPLGISVEGGVGSGILPGYGSPDLRIYAGVRYAMEDKDKDDDGIEDASDKCVDDPEDKDGHDDADGCPDPDNDGDGLPDVADNCRDEAEDPDAWKDEDGCPEPDNDNDTVLDADDKCPNEAGLPAYAGCAAPDRDKDGVADADDKCVDVPGNVELGGCPDADNDGIADAADKCPDQAGAAPTGCPDKDGDGVLDLDDRCPEQPGTVDLKGCADTDKDGIADPDDKCPTEAEIINGVEDEDGCPDKGKVLVTVTAEKISLAETVYFDSGKDTIQKRSFALLDQVALVMKAHPEIKKVQIEGHTDSQGDDAFNLDLSKRRAASVVSYLVNHGVSADRLGSEGFGETKPIADNKTKAGREKNRRVELRIVDQ